MRIPRLFWIWFGSIALGLVLVGGYVLYWESNISYLQARFLSRYAAPMGRWHLPPHWVAEGERFSKEAQAAGPRERFPRDASRRSGDLR